MVQKRLKLKSKSLIIIILLVLIIGLGSAFLIKGFMNKKKNSLNELDKAQELRYYNMKNENEYQKYAEANPKLSIEDVITYVNIGLNNEYYTNTKKALHLNERGILVNKYNYLEKDYVPNNLKKLNTKYAKKDMKLVSYAKSAYEKMAGDAKNNKLNIIVTSSYRSYEYQEKLYNEYVKKDGKIAADTYSARPGYSEHQTGLAVDLSTKDYSYENFEKSKEFKWMQKNAYKYGFILRYPKDKEKITGYKYEPWHYRYVGVNTAKIIHDNNLSLEEYYVRYIDV